MRIYSEKGRNDIFFEFTERNFDNKIKAFNNYYKKFTQKFFKRKDKITGVYINYQWGYKTKEPGIYYTSEVFPIDKQITIEEIKKLVLSFTQGHHNNWLEVYDDPDERGIYYLRGIQINYLYT